MSRAVFHISCLELVEKSVLDLQYGCVFNPLPALSTLQFLPSPNPTNSFINTNPRYFTRSRDK